MCLYNPRTRRLSVAMRNDPYPSQHWTCIVSLAAGLCDVFPPIWLRRCIVCYVHCFQYVGQAAGAWPLALVSFPFVSFVSFVRLVV